jgi:hypothetical protein
MEKLAVYSQKAARSGCTGLSGEPMVGHTNGQPRNPRVTRGRPNGLKGTPDCPVRQRL